MTSPLDEKGLEAAKEVLYGRHERGFINEPLINLPNGTLADAIRAYLAVSQPIGDGMDKSPGRCWPLGGYAPGNYTCTCVSCGKMHEADKRASQCLVCAVSDAHALIAAKDARIEELTREKDEALAEIERMTPKFVAYEYLESPAGREAAEARIKALEEAIDEIADFDVDGPLSPEAVLLIRIAGAARRATLNSREKAE